MTSKRHHLNAVSLIKEFLDKFMTSYKEEEKGSEDLKTVMKKELEQLWVSLSSGIPVIYLMIRRMQDKNTALSDTLWHSCNDILRQMLDIFDSTKKDIIISSEQYSVCEYEAIPDERLYPVSNFCAFPMEIISNIFEMAICEEDRRERAPKHAIRLSSINRQCRDIAIHTPRLWTTVFETASPEITDTFIERSSAMNLDVYLRGISDHERFFSQIKDHLHRIGALFIENLGNYGGWKRELELYSGKLFPNLSRLTIDPCRTSILDPELFDSMIMPNLKFYEGPAFQTRVHIPWTKALTHCSFLTFFSFRHYRAISLPSCESLRIVLNQADEFINTAYLPNLRHLDLEQLCSPDVDGNFDKDVALLSLLKKLIPTRQLVSLKITLNSGIRERSYIRQLVLSELPFDNLRSLQIRYTSSKVLHISCSAESMPVLEHLEISKLIVRMNSNKYLSMTRSLPTLKSICFNNCDDIGETELVELVVTLSDSPRPQRIDRIQFNHCGFDPSLLSDLEYMMPRQFKWCEST